MLKLLESLLATRTPQNFLIHGIFSRTVHWHKIKVSKQGDRFLSLGIRKIELLASL